MAQVKQTTKKLIFSQEEIDAAKANSVERQLEIDMQDGKVVTVEGFNAFLRRLGGPLGNNTRVTCALLFFHHTTDGIRESIMASPGRWLHELSPSEEIVALKGIWGHTKRTLELAVTFVRSMDRTTGARDAFILHAWTHCNGDAETNARQLAQLAYQPNKVMESMNAALTQEDVSPTMEPQLAPTTGAATETKSPVQAAHPLSVDRETASPKLIANVFDNPAAMMQRFNWPPTDLQYIQTALRHKIVLTQPATTCAEAASETKSPAHEKPNDIQAARPLDPAASQHIPSVLRSKITQTEEEIYIVLFSNQILSDMVLTVWDMNDRIAIIPSRLEKARFECAKLFLNKASAILQKEIIKNPLEWVKYLSSKYKCMALREVWRVVAPKDVMTAQTLIAAADMGEHRDAMILHIWESCEGDAKRNIPTLSILSTLKGRENLVKSMKITTDAIDALTM